VPENPWLATDGTTAPEHLARDLRREWETRAELKASRARVVAAADEARRRLRRELREGAQQDLVSAVLALKMARQELGADGISPATELLDEALAHANDAVEALRELAHRILPGALARDGLRGGIGALVSRVRLPVTAEVTAERLPGPLEATAYFIVAEAVANTVKHARARSVHIAAVVDGGLLRLVVRDDGVGGARYDGSSGLLGLRDRAAAVNGRLHVVSPVGGGTVVTAALPIPAVAGENR
jgi:signal transduction histidine kinase